MSQERESAPPGVDTTVAHSARMYDWWIGGKDNFAADRALDAACSTRSVEGISVL